MVTNNTLITAPVSIADVKTVLGATSNDLGILCKRSNINPTARYKPFKGGGIGVEPNLWPGIGTSMGPGWEDGDETNVDGQGHLSNRASATFGTNVPVLTWDSDGFPNSGGVWTFNGPTGGVNEPFRLTDFNGYIHTPANCWSYNIVGAPHFALRNSSPTQAQRKFTMTFTPFKPDGGNPDKYYLSLKDIALTSFSNLYNLYVWCALIVESTDARNYTKTMYAKRVTSSLGAISSSSPIPFEFDIISDFTPIIAVNNGQPVFDTTSDTTGNQCGLYNIRGPFKIQFFIGPYANSNGFVSSIYSNDIIIGGTTYNFKDTYGWSALEPEQYDHNCLSLAGKTAGSDVSTIKYFILSWNTNLTENWCDSYKNIIQNTSSAIQPLISANRTISNNKTIYTFSSSLYCIFKRSSSDYDYIDTFSTTVYYRIRVTYYISNSVTYTIGSDTTQQTGETTVTTSSGNFSIPLGGTSAGEGVPPSGVSIFQITINHSNYQGIGLAIALEISSSSSGTYEVKLPGQLLGFS